VLDQRGRLPFAAAGFAALHALVDRALYALRTWLDSWSGIGHVTVGMAHRGYDLQLTRDDEKGWRATFYAKGDGALAHERHGLSMGADTVARGPGCGARCT
jgi:hypothetical protein